MQKSFAGAERLLSELCGWDLDDETVRRATHAAARAAAAARPDRADAARFAAADGVVEVPIDAGKVNTLDGWRDVKLAVVSKRPPGEPATPAGWDDRELPDPTARTVVAAVEDSDRFADRVRAGGPARRDGDPGRDRPGRRGRMDLEPGGPGAAAGGRRVGRLPRPGTPRGGVKATWGDTPEAERRRVEGRSALLERGKAGIDEWLGRTMADIPGGATTDALLAFAAYLANHPTHLDYAGRLAAGRSIGSGQVEGAVERLVNLRLKRTGARWHVEHVGPLVELIALSDTPEWGDLWTAA